MTTRREFLKSSAGTGVSAVAALSAVQSMAADQGTQHEARARIDYVQQLESARAAAGVTGASFAYWDGTKLHTAAAGVRNSVTGDPVTVDTLMFIGSITKVLNAALMMQLVDEGKIALEDPVIEHLPELRLRDQQARQRITCQMLVNHTNGIDCDWLPEYGPDEERIVDTIQRCADLGQLYAPGEFASYSNLGTVIAGYLSQKLRGESWYTLMKTRIYEPLGMRHALVDPLDVPRFRVSTGDITDRQTGKLVQSPKSFLQPSLAPAGSTQMMTATDLVTFARAMLNGGVGSGPRGQRILSAASAARMTRRTAAFVPMASPIEIGLGWMILPGRVLTHTGNGRGVLARVYAHPTSGRVMALLTNCDRGERLMATFMDPILTSWTGIRNPSPQRKSGPLDSSLYVGAYENNLARIEVFAYEGALAMRYGTKIRGLQNADASMPPSKLYPLGNHLFAADPLIPGNPQLELRFVQPHADGRMQFLASMMRLFRRAA